MDDINFEELDKAVNSALQQNAPKVAPVQEEPAVVAAVQPVEDSAPVTPVQKSVIPDAPPRRRGQFMDMVHPSSDMIRPMSTRPSRQAPMIQPLDPSIVETSEPVVSQPEVVHPSEMAVPYENHAATEETMKSEWPDPLDVMEQTKQEKLDEAPEAFSESTTLISEVADSNSDTQEESSPRENNAETQDAQTSPFISGSGLEKRPLGAFADAPATAEAAEEEPAQATGEPADDNETDSLESQQAGSEDPQDELPIVPMPQELTPEVVSVESDDSTHSSEDQEEASDDAAAAAPDASGPMTASISQQYKSTETSLEDQNSHPVFDTKDYHQPLTPPAKRGHTGVIVTITLILLAILGAGAWYAVAVLKLI